MSLSPWVPTRSRRYESRQPDPVVWKAVNVSLYAVQKFLYQLNRTPGLQAAYREDPHASLQPYELDPTEIGALVGPDIGYLFHLGVNGQILMHFAAFHEIQWADYLQQMRDGIAAHGPVRDGVYAMTGYQGVEAHNADLGQRTDRTDA